MPKLIGPKVLKIFR